MYNVNSKIQTITKRLPLMAAILGAGLAMAQPTTHNRPLASSSNDGEWYRFTGSASDNPYDFSKYALSSGGVSDCEGSEMVCGVRLDPTTDVDGSNQIKATAAIHSEIASALSNQASSSNVALKEE